MVTILITVHLLIALALVVLVLLQRSEGGALGMGGGGGGAFKSRGVGNALTRLTAILAACFFASSIGLTILANYDSSGSNSVIDKISTEQGGKPQAPQSSEGGAPKPVLPGSKTQATPEAPKVEIKPAIPAAPKPEVKAPAAPSAPTVPTTPTAPPAPQTN